MMLNSRAFARLLGRPDVAEDPRFADAAGRSTNRTDLYEELEPEVKTWRKADLLAAMEAAKLPGGQVNEIPDMLASPQIVHRGMVQELARDDGTAVKILCFPGKFSKTPPNYRHAPPRLGEDSRSVLREELQLDDAELERLCAAGVIAGE